jgi:hypothetical protein
VGGRTRLSVMNERCAHRSRENLPPPFPSSTSPITKLDSASFFRCFLFSISFQSSTPHIGRTADAVPCVPRVQASLIFLFFFFARLSRGQKKRPSGAKGIPTHARKRLWKIPLAPRTRNKASGGGGRRCHLCVRVSLV